MSVSFIFPAFNEAENLARFPNEVFPVFDTIGRPYEIVIVDDGSSDTTATIAGSLGDRVRLIKHARNMGLGAALKTGIAAAKNELVITMDADLTFAPSLVHRLLERYSQGDVDAVIGSPKMAQSAANLPRYRVFISECASLAYSMVLGKRLSAASPIFRLYRRCDLQDLPLRTDGFDINAEILFHLIQQKKRIAEVAAPLTQRIHGESKLDYPKEMQRHAKLICSMLWWRLSSAAR